MTLFDEHKSERRERIMAAARTLVAIKGYDGLTMRDLARAAKVSVPTLYNLFGSKDAILIAELQASASRIGARLATGDSFFTRGMASFDAGMELIAEAPEFYRAVTQMAMTSPETAPMRQRAVDAYVAIMAGNLAAAKQVDQLAAWAEPEIVARHMYAQFMACFLSWSVGELDWNTFRAAALSGICHILLGVVRGAFADDVLAFIHALHRDSSLHTALTEVRHVASRTQD